MLALPFNKLNESNYDDWKVLMEALLEENGLLELLVVGMSCLQLDPTYKGVTIFLTHFCIAFLLRVYTSHISLLPSLA